MSSFMLSDKAISQLAKSLLGHTHRLMNTHPHMGEVKVPANPAIGTAAICFTPEESLARKLYGMNRDAVEGRYADPEVEPFEYVEMPHILDKVRLLKLLECYTYQCSEGDVPERRLYTDLIEIERRLRREIVRALPEYDRAPWGG